MPMQTFTFTGAKRQRAPNVKRDLDARIRSILQETFVEGNWGFDQVLAHLRKVLDIPLTPKQLRTRIKNFRMRRMDRANHALLSPGLTATTGATPFTATESAIVTPRSDAVSLQGDRPGPLLVNENVVPPNHLSNFHFNFAPPDSVHTGQALRDDIFDPYGDELRVCESQLKPHVLSLSSYHPPMGPEGFVRHKQTASEQQMARTSTIQSSALSDEMDVDVNIDMSSSPDKLKPIADTTVNSTSSQHNTDVDLGKAHDDGDNTDIMHDPPKQNETYSASTANLVRQIERVLGGPLTVTSGTQHPGQSAPEPHLNARDTLVLKNVHGPDLVFTAPWDRIQALLDTTVKDRFWRPDVENISVNNLDYLERLATVYMSCGWTQDASSCFSMVFQHWVMNDAQPGHHGQALTPLIRATNILVRLLQLKPTDGSDEQCLKRWVSHMRSKQNHSAGEHIPMCLAPEEVVAIRHLGVILCKQHNSKYFSKVCRLLGDMDPTQYNQSTPKSPSLPPMSVVQTPNRCIAIVSELEHIVTTSALIPETKSLFATALQDILRWIQTQLISNSTILNQNESDPNVSMLWYRAPSLGDLELLEQRLLVAFLCHQTWQLGKNGGPPLRPNLHKHLPLCFSQEWFSSDVPLLTFTVLSHMAKGLWAQSQPLDQRYWRERRVYAIQQLMKDPAQTAKQFSEMAMQLDGYGFHSVLSFTGEFLAGYDSQSSTFFVHMDGRVPMTEAQYKEGSLDLVRSVIKPSLDSEDPDQRGTFSFVPEYVDPPLNSAPGSTFSLRSLVKRASDIGSRFSRGSSYLYRPSVIGSDTHDFLGPLKRASRGTARESYQLPPPQPSIPVMHEDETMHENQ